MAQKMQQPPAGLFHVPSPLETMHERVAEFNREIVGTPQPDAPSTLSPSRTQFRAMHLREEVDEFEAESNLGNLEGAADGLIDLIYVALGALYEMGVNPGPTFDEVHRANMTKVRGEKATRPGSGGFDAIKPEGWVGPDHGWITEATPERVEIGRVAERRGITAEMLDTMSEAFIHCTKVRAGKGRDYNTSVELPDYFKPWGHKSHHQMMHLKTLRARSLIELMDRGKVPNYEGLLDTLWDALNYISFWVEDIQAGRLPLTGERGAEANGFVQTKC